MSTHQKQPCTLDMKGFSHIYSACRERLTRSVARFVRDQNAAEDVAAAAFEAAWEKREGFRGQASPYTWLHAVALNRARELWRRDRAVRLDSIDRCDAWELASFEVPTETLERQDDGIRLQQALNVLAAKYRLVLVSHFIDGYSIRDIARREGIPFGTVLSRIYKAKRLLRHAWEVLS